MPLNIILASSPNGVIGSAGSLPWSLPEELELFKKLTVGSIVYMGSKTWKSLGCKPLPRRYNVVISKSGEVEGSPNLVLQDIRLIPTFSVLHPGMDVWVIGGQQLVDSVLSLPDVKVGKIYISRINKFYTGDVYFRNRYNFRLDTFSDFSTFQHLVYTPHALARVGEAGYLSLLQKIIDHGTQQDDRTGVGTLALCGETLTFDMQEGFPLLTTKQMAWRAVQNELFFFLAGKTNTKELEKKGVNIWKAHTSKEFLLKRGLDYEEGEMGPMYGYQWRNFGGKGLDQLKNVVELIQTDPFSRRLLMTSYNPEQADAGVLYPCHGLTVQFFCRRDAEGMFWLSLCMYQRSADAFLGLPFNIASYAALLHIIAFRVGMKPDKLTIFLGNVHLYSNHIECAKLQLTRAPLVLPFLQVLKVPEEWGELDENCLKLWGYFCYPKIRADISV